MEKIVSKRFGLLMIGAAVALALTTLVIIPTSMAVNPAMEVKN